MSAAGPLQGAKASPGGSAGTAVPSVGALLPAALSPFERQLVAATQGGLPLVPQPYEAVGALLGVSARQVQDTLASLLARGVIRRIGAVPNHYRLGYVANGMTVWDVDDERVDELGERIAQLAGVTHCYRRSRALPDWPYNLFVMLHGRTRAEVERQALTVRDLLGQACRDRAILYSTQLLKKTGVRLPGGGSPKE